MNQEGFPQVFGLGMPEELAQIAQGRGFSIVLKCGPEVDQFGVLLPAHDPRGPLLDRLVRALQTDADVQRLVDALVRMAPNVVSCPICHAPMSPRLLGGRPVTCSCALCRFAFFDPDRPTLLYQYDGRGWNARLPSGAWIAFPRSGGVFIQHATAARVDRLEADTVRRGEFLDVGAVRNYVRSYLEEAQGKPT